MHTLERVEVQRYTFGGFNLIAKKYQSRYKWIWLMICDGCGQQISVKQLGSEYWVAKCQDCKIEFTITPAAVYKEVPTDLSRVM